jgi:hypothetical protein
MSKALFMKPVLEKLEQGSFFRSKFALLVRVLAVLLALGMLLVMINLWRGGLSDAPGSTIFAGIVFQLFLVAGTYMAVHVMFIKAREIDALREGPYVVLPIAALFLKMLGEIYATLAVAVALGGGFAMWITGAAPRSLFLHDVELFLPSSPLLRGIDNAFLGGLAFMVTGTVAALLWLAIFYFLSEVVTVLADIGTSARRRV